MDASTLTCPQCGAPAASDATECAFCRARLATVACPSCFGLVFVGSKHCAHCGAKIEPVVASADARPRSCPRGCGEMHRLTVGGVTLDECEGCSGVWLETETFRRLCEVQEQRATAALPDLAAPSTGATIAARASRSDVRVVRYVRCPDCGGLMNRHNFSHISGIIIDSCAAHGTWFDADELRAVVEFIRAGGLERARIRLRTDEEALKAQDLRARQARLSTLRLPVRPPDADPGPVTWDVGGGPRLPLVSNLVTGLVTLFLS